MSLKAKFNSQYARFLVALPMDDPFFIAGLIAGEILPGDTKDEIRAKDTNAQKAKIFLEKCIAPSFSDDGTENLMLQKLLKIMLDSDYVHVKELAKELIKDDGEDEKEMQQAFSLALKDRVASSSVTIYILGQEKAGKTCLVASLLGNKFEEQ